MATTNAAAAAPAKTPVTMLSGFLGAGKTTLLRYLLENSGERIACIVNDVASINIDAKLVRNDRNRGRGDAVNSTSDLADTIELANGCACCNLQDELFASFEQVLALADKKGLPYTRIVLENSGVAEPQNIRDKFNEAAAAGHPLMARVDLDTLVTVVDSGSFIADYASKAALTNRPELGDGGNMRPVVDLLVEQIECADFVLLNKIDMLPEPDKLAELVAIVSSLNPLATVLPCQNGKIDIPTVFGSNVHPVVAKLNTEGQHRGAVAAALALEAAARKVEAAATEAAKHSHSHGPAHGEPGHSHDDASSGQGHDHKHSHDHDHACCHTHKPAHGEEGHIHDEHCSSGHDDDHGRKPAHGEAGHVHDDSCHHDHAHGHEHDDSCHHGHEHDSNPTHGQPGHVHTDSSTAGHAHSPDEPPETRAALRFGIRSFVYSRRRPFHPQRLRDMVLRWLPVTHNKALEGAAIEPGDSPIKSVLRSKGFMWTSSSHSTAYFWSHAGQHFEIRDEGDWWAAVPDKDWPDNPEQRNVILHDFGVTAGTSAEYGDRRQEIVFIGVNMDQAKICEQMDSALLTDEEMVKYATRWASTPDPKHAALSATPASHAH